VPEEKEQLGLSTLIDNFSPNTLQAALERLLPQIQSWDIATGTFDIGALLALDGLWQPVKPIHLLMGDETTRRTRKELLNTLANQADSSIEDTKEEDDFAALGGLEAVREALKKEQIRVRIYNRAKFHAKAHILKASDQNLSSAIIGSSNFTRPGLTVNVELNLLSQNPAQVASLSDWFDRLWKDSESVAPELLKVIERHLRAFTPFEVWAKALYEYFAGRESPLTDWEEKESRIFPVLSRYQQDGYRQARRIAQQWGGAFICDSPGLGKTYIGLMLLEYYLARGERILLIVPKSAMESIWKRDIKRYLHPYYRIACEEHLKIHSHTDFGREGTISQERLEYYRDYFPIIIVDEAHHFRTPWANRSRVLQMLCSGGCDKTTYLITATPINNSALDLYHLVNYFARGQTDYFAAIGIHSLRRHFNLLEKSLDEVINSNRSVDLQTAVQDVDVLRTDQLLKAVVIQRSRAYVKESEKQSGDNVLFPEREKPQVIPYSLRKVYAHLYDDLKAAFSKDEPLLSLALYNPEAFRKGKADPELLNRDKQVIGLIRTLLLKRLESSCNAFEASLEDLLRRMAAFLSQYAPQSWENWGKGNGSLWDIVDQHRRERFLNDEPDAEVEEENEFDDIEVRTLKNPEDYKLDELMHKVQEDMDILAILLDGIYEHLDPTKDDKLQNLAHILCTDVYLKQGKVVIFTEFRDTARYLEKELRDRFGFNDVKEVDSTRKVNREELIKCFAPYYNCTDEELTRYVNRQIRILISTDVLSEGLNLQDAQLIVNYDLHWNPVRLMQRIGRVDRRLNPEIEASLGRKQPVKVFIYNFLPPEELEELLKLRQRIDGKLLRISKTLGIEAPLLTPEDEWEALRLFNAKYEGSESIEERLHLELQQIHYGYPELWEELPSFPRRIFTGKQGEAKGLFCAYRLPNPKETEAPGEVRWYFRRADTGEIQGSEHLEEIAKAVRSFRATPRITQASVQELKSWREDIERRVKEHLKALQSPLGAKAKLICWMEIC
jgi:superfamily II DNA or RNA helicase